MEATSAQLCDFVKKMLRPDAPPRSDAMSQMDHVEDAE
jgi:hypothetical protein